MTSYEHETFHTILHVKQELAWIRRRRDFKFKANMRVGGYRVVLAFTYTNLFT